MEARYGSWKSPITAQMVTSGNCKNICELQFRNDSVFWIEQQYPDGRRAIFERRSSGDIVEWSVPNVSVRNRVHEYGGGSFICTQECIFYTTVDGLFKQRDPFSIPEVIVSSPVLRFADLEHHNGCLYAVVEEHQNENAVPENYIAKITLDGVVSRLIDGCDFYAAPRVSPNGRHIAWMEWNLPNMPWDKTHVCIAEIEASGKRGRTVAVFGTDGSNVQCAEWASNISIHLICDKTNWWNVYKVDLESPSILHNVYAVEEEIGVPLWQFADRQYATNANGVLLNVANQLTFVHNGGAVQKIDTAPYKQFRYLTIDERNVVHCIASGPTRSESVIRIDISSNHIDVIRECIDSQTLNGLDISIPEKIYFKSDGYDVYGWFYLPVSSSYVGRKGELPPVILKGHGGPTASASDSLDLKTQFFTSRGFAVFDVNYRGSTGCGTHFRNLLKKNWGIVDRNDMVNGAKMLCDTGRVDKDGVCIMGSSAGGFLALASIISAKIFSAAACMYAVSDLVGLTKDTHKFELGYNDELIGRYPEDKAIYEARSPIKNAKSLTCPIIFFHGDCDTVVPLAQTVTLYEAVRSNGLMTSLIVYPDEGHGFRKACTIQKTIDGTYYFFCRALGIPPSLPCKVEIENWIGEESIVHTAITG